MRASSITIPPLPSLALQNNNAHDDNVNFLRSRARSSPDSPSSLSRQRRRRLQQQQQLQQQQHQQQQLHQQQHQQHQETFPELNFEPMDLDDAQDLRMSVEVNRRIPILRRQREESAYVPNYERRNSNARSLYGWFPESEEEEADDVAPVYEPLPEGFSSWFGRLSDRQSVSGPHVRRHSSGVSPPAYPAELQDADRHHNINDPPTSMAEALLQSMRRQPRFSRARTLHNYALERDRADREAEESRERSGPSTSRAYRFLPTNRGETPRPLTHNDLRARISAHRQMHMDNPPSPRLTETIKYLDRLRDSYSVEDSIESAANGGFGPWALENNNDFILDTISIPTPPQCSWLRPGMVFSGSQKAAANGAGALGSHRITPNSPPPPDSSSNDPIVVNGSSHENNENNESHDDNPDSYDNNHNNGRINVHTSSGRRYLANGVYSLGNGRDENWPVRVTIHDINYHDMTLSGTMEAYNIPDKTSPSQDAHIVTFLEGEIIDFNTHTLETKNFKADAEIDSTYWRELQPFKDQTDEEMTRNLVSQKWISEQLAKGWILMRWKGEFFSFYLPVPCAGT